MRQDGARGLYGGNAVDVSAMLGGRLSGIHCALLLSCSPEDSTSPIRRLEYVLFSNGPECPFDSADWGEYVFGTRDCVDSA
jgi:hypothetical protein